MTTSPRELAERRSVSGRIVALLAAFGSPPAPALSLTALSDRSGLPLTTVHRLVGQLVEVGLLERLPDGPYRVGLRLWELGLLAPRSQGLRQLAMPYLEDLYEVTHENVQLMVLDGPDVVVVERLSSHDAVAAVGRAGGRLPIHATGGGLAMLAYADDAVLTNVLARPLTRYTDDTVTSESELAEQLALARRQGWIECREHLVAGSISIAAPVLVRGRPIAAVSVVLDIARDTRGFVPAILTTARAIARSLGPVIPA